MKYKCKYCNKEFDSRQQMAGHVSRCKYNPNYLINLDKSKKSLDIARKNNKQGSLVHKGEKCECQYCHNIYNLYGLKNHERYCECNPNKSKINRETHYSPGGWNKGLTKESDERVKKGGETYKERYNTGKIKVWCEGKHLPDEMKKKISESQKRFYEEHPDRIPYKLYHSSQISYPEQYFKDVFEQENIPLKYHLQVGLYELDFYNEEYKVYIEIDGDTHKQKKVQEIDKRKDEYLQSLGWKGMRVCWADYQKLSHEEKELEIKKIKDFIIL